MAPDDTHIYEFRPPLLITSVFTTDGTLLSIFSTRHLSSNAFTVPSTSYVLCLSMNFTFVSQLIDYDCQVIFNSTLCHVQDHSRTVIGVGHRHSGVYMWTN